MSFPRIVSRAGGGLAALVAAAALAGAAPGRAVVRSPSSSGVRDVTRLAAVREAAPAAPAGFSAGAVAVVDASGAAVAGNVFTSRDQVHLVGGPFDPSCAIGALADGTWNYQVTDASGQTLLSGAPRSLEVSGGVIVSAEGASTGTGACGSEIVALAPFDRAPNGSGNYRLWLTPAADLQTGASCGSGCYFGFLPAFSTTQTFAVREDSRCRTTHCLSGIVFSDDDQNGVRDSGEPGIAGVVISATDGHGIAATAISGPDGTWSICGLPETTYTVTETVPAGFRQTAPNATVQISRYLASVATDAGGSFTVTFCNESFSNLAFGNAALPGSISGTKFNDANGNGLLDTGEAGVAGVTINLFAGSSASGTPVAAAATDASGAFSFGNLAAGTYALTEDLPAGYRQTVPGGDGNLLVSLAPGQSVTDALFGNQLATGAITGTKFDDANGNGARDPGEGGLAGVTIQLTGPFGPSSTTTDADGNFSFTGLAPASYVLSEIVPEGYHQTFPAPPGTMTIALSAGQTATALFGNQALAATGSITGLKFDDANGNGAQDPGEAGVAGVTIDLFAASGGALVATTVTAADGTFAFTGINPGSYQVSEVVPDGFVQTVPGGSGMVPVTVSAGETASGVLFGNRAATSGGTISGFVFNDVNKNGVQDEGEPPLPNVTIRLRTSSGDLVATTWTDATGHFSFTGVAPGDYTVEAQATVSFFQTFPPNHAAIPVHLEPGGTVSDLVFGFGC